MSTLRQLIQKFTVSSTSTGELTSKIHSYTYGVFNRTNKPIKAVLDVSKSKNMLFNLKEPVVSKVR